MVNQSTAIVLAQSYLNAVQAKGTRISHAFLFGSYARNQQHEWSDIDIALIGDDFVGVTVIDKEPFRVLHLLPEFNVIEIHTFPSQRMQNADPFLSEILNTGIELFVNQHIEVAM